ncbi:hypothetical protein BHE74_00014435 [Ensete ventricosum]|nr:hypothetical protein BHE74_00014435 [Ensete ventricosum]RZR96745.1 hypothetical protein BHM03_00025799 [Ensete ventricosum]
MGGFVSHHLRRSRWDLRSSNNRGEDTPLDLVCVKLEKVLCLADRIKTKNVWGSSDKEIHSKGGNFIQ